MATDIQTPRPLTSSKPKEKVDPLLLKLQFDKQEALTQIDEVDRELTARGEQTARERVHPREFATPDPQMLVFLESIRPQLEDAYGNACIFKAQHVDLKKMRELFKKDKSHQWLVKLGLSGPELFNDRRYILRALRDKLDSNYVERMVEKYEVKERRMSMQTVDKTHMAKKAPELSRIPTTLVKQYSDVFRKLDEDDDGLLTAEEFVKGFDMPWSDAEDLIAEADIDGDRQIDFVEFVKLMDKLENDDKDSSSSSDDEATADSTTAEVMEKLPGSVLKNYKRAFDSLDLHKKGMVTPVDISRAMGIEKDEAWALIQATPRLARVGDELGGLDFPGFVYLLQRQDDGEHSKKTVQDIEDTLFASELEFMSQVNQAPKADLEFNERWYEIIHKLFQMLDRDHDGFVVASDFFNAMRSHVMKGGTSDDKDMEFHFAVQGAIDESPNRKLDSKQFFELMCKFPQFVQ